MQSSGVRLLTSNNEIASMLDDGDAVLLPRDSVVVLLRFECDTPSPALSIGNIIVEWSRFV